MLQSPSVGWKLESEITWKRSYVCEPVSVRTACNQAGGSREKFLTQFEPLREDIHEEVNERDILEGRKKVAQTIGQNLVFPADIESEKRSFDHYCQEQLNDLT